MGCDKSLPAASIGKYCTYLYTYVYIYMHIRGIIEFVGVTRQLPCFGSFSDDPFPRPSILGNVTKSVKVGAPFLNSFGPGPADWAKMST